MTVLPCTVGTNEVGSCVGFNVGANKLTRLQKFEGSRWPYYLALWVVMKWEALLDSWWVLIN